jgi:hypothetical protein
VDSRFDGDALNISISTDNDIVRHWQALAPHKNVFEMTSPREISGNISMPKPVISTMSNFLKSKGAMPTNEQLNRFNALPDA